MSQEVLQSKTISFLRFPLIVGVVFIHSYCKSFVMDSGIEVSNTDLPIYCFFSELFSQVLGRLAVPMFFLFSGFLFFKTGFDTPPSLLTYVYKFKKRIYTLLVPYLLWNLFHVCLYFITSRIPLLSSYFSHPNYSLSYILKAFWSTDGFSLSAMTYPAVYPLWFIRDLMVISLLTPVIYWLVNKLKTIGLLIFLACWFFNLWPSVLDYNGMSISAWFFFYAGAWLSIRKKNLVEVSTKFSTACCLLYPILVGLDIYTKSDSCNVYIHNLGIIVGIVACIFIVSHCIHAGKWKVNSFWVKASFFVYALHEPFLLSQIRKILFTVIYPVSDFGFTAFYFIGPILTILSALLLYLLLDRYMPILLRIVTGR